MRLYLPHGYGLFKAAIKTPVLSGDGYIYIALTAAAPDAFGPMVMRFPVNGNQLERVALAEAFPYPGSEGALSVEAGQLFFYGSTESAELHKIQVPGFVPLATGAVAPQPQPAPAPSNIDQLARDAAAGAMQRANVALQKATIADQLATNATLELRKRPTAEQVADIAWQKAGDRIAFWWNTAVDYMQAPQLYNVIWNRVVKHLVGFGLIGQDRAKLNDDESLRM